MSYTVTVYFDNMIDETHYFETEAEASECHEKLKNRYRHQRLYQVEMEVVK